MAETMEEWEINLEEPTLALLINQLDLLNQLLNKQRIKDNRLPQAIQSLNDLETENDWQQFKKLWKTLSLDLKEAMNSLPSANLFEVIAPFYQIEALVGDFDTSDGFLNYLKTTLGDTNFESLPEVKEALEKATIPFFVKEIQPLIPISSNGILLEDFQKVLKASPEVEDYAEVEEAQSILLGLFDLIPPAVKQNNKNDLEQIYRNLMHNESRLNLINLITDDFVPSQNVDNQDNK
ncbi:hypothetical protein JN01_0589 [Entomoplasma freundtii]|uniref:Uncharacterized protein n=1 Tax=Entomoplasma freundtii TaxID=74700 RepID=A0A2K8NR99_9MOLU|nr:hypothetical protein [Entomoplasma freundtii]ATZ16370.1 hypothetical protein EFREU_v1c03440 [Entomoplasma freundtii]TDY56591.1 hypothetical protein JN01_0589 [Entomoplasma freundtii]